LYSVNGGNTNLPKEVLGIPVKRQADALFFLHAMAWWAADVFKFRVHYADQTSVEIRFAANSRCWTGSRTRASWADELARHNTVAGWTGPNGVGQKVTAYCYEWQNPHPEKEIATVDFLTEPKSGYAPVPILVGLTAATLHANEGVVEDVIGTKGIRVVPATGRSRWLTSSDRPAEGTRLLCGRRGEAQDMVVGKQVRLVDDALTAEQGRPALVLRSPRTNAPAMDTMVNAMLIGEGLSDAGDYEANNRQRAYLENLKFIAEQSKRGMWR